MPACELHRVAVKMLEAHLVVNALVAALEHRPEGFDSVGMRLAVHVLFNAMPDGLMVIVLAEISVSDVFVGVDGCAILDRVAHEAFKVLGIDVLDTLYADTASNAVFRTDHGGFTLKYPGPPAWRVASRAYSCARRRSRFRQPRRVRVVVQCRLAMLRGYAGS